MSKQKEGEKKVLVVGMEFRTLHRGKHFGGFPDDGQVFDPADFTAVRLAALLASGALKWEVINTKTVTPAETKEKYSLKAGSNPAYPTPLDKEN